MRLGMPMIGNFQLILEEVKANENVKKISEIRKEVSSLYNWKLLIMRNSISEFLYFNKKKFTTILKPPEYPANNTNKKVKTVGMHTFLLPAPFLFDLEVVSFSFYIFFLNKC